MSSHSIFRLLGDKYLIQYIHESTSTTTTCTFDFVIDNYDQQTYLYDLCNNAYDDFGIRTSGRIYYLDKDQPVNYLDYKSVTRQSITYNMEFDIIRIWFVRGINPLQSIDAIAISFLLPLKQVRQKLNVGLFVINKDNFTNLINIDKEITYGDTLFDKYVEFKIPRLSYLETDYINNGTSSFAWQISYDFDTNSFIGLDFDSNPEISLYELYDQQSVFDGTTGSEYIHWDIYNSFNTTLSVPELYSDLALDLNIDVSKGIIQYRMYNTQIPMSAFINHLINKNPTSTFTIKHRIKVYGVQSSNLYILDSTQIYQTDDWDKTHRYKPVIDNPNLYSSIVINYDATLIDNFGSSYMLFASIVHNNPSDFELSPITISLSSTPNIVYNRIINQKLDVDKLFYDKDFYILETKDGSAIINYDDTKQSINQSDAQKTQVVVVDTKDVVVTMNNNDDRLIQSNSVNIIIKPTTESVFFRLWIKDNISGSVSPFDLYFDAIYMKFYNATDIIGQTDEYKLIDSNGLMLFLQDDLVKKILLQLSENNNVFYDVIGTTKGVKSTIVSGRVIRNEQNTTIIPNITPANNVSDSNNLNKTLGSLNPDNLNNTIDTLNPNNQNKPNI